MNPDDLLAQADYLLGRPTDGRPRQADLRRAVSASYYAVFHHLLAACAFELTKSSRTAARYELVYRSISHTRVQTVCRQITNSTPSSGVLALRPSPGFDVQLRKGAALFLELIERRYEADYSPSYKLGLEQAKTIVANARLAIASFRQSIDADRLAFLTLLVCDPRPDRR